MRVTFLLLTALGTAGLLGACSESRTPTERSGATFNAAGSRDTTGRPSHYISNGATADVYWYGGGSDSLGGGGSWMYGYLSANRNSQVNDEWTSINWSVQECDALGCRYSSGYGTVPGAALTGRGGGDLRLALDPADYPGAFYVYGDSIGPIDVTWRPSGAYSSRSTGVTEYSYPGYSYRSNGVTESASAFAAGHVGSHVVPSGATGSMGTTHAMTISFYH